MIEAFILKQKDITFLRIPKVIYNTRPQSTEVKCTSNPKVFKTTRPIIDTTSYDFEVAF